MTEFISAQAAACIIKEHRERWGEIQRISRLIEREAGIGKYEFDFKVLRNHTKALCRTMGEAGFALEPRGSDSTYDRFVAKIPIDLLRSEGESPLKEQGEVEKS